MNNTERKKHLNSIRKKLSFFIKQNKNLNLRDLSRKLKKNDAYLQQYISRGSPAFLPEEERKILSEIIKLDINLLTPNWLRVTTNDDKNLLSFKDKLNNKEIKISSSLLDNYKNLKINFIEFTDLKIKRNNYNYSVKVIFDKNVSSFVDDNFYLLQDKSEIFLVHLSKYKNDTSLSSKIIVKPYDTNLRPFRIEDKSLIIHSKVIFLGSLEKLNKQNA
tara:strand:- start:436 stop:1089 length:654 start_codon:yes stop_codon:yes gene_type:complete